MTPDAATILGLLADERRRKVVAALVLGRATPDEITAATGLDVRAVVTALHRLRSAGIAGDDSGRWELHAAVFADAAKQAASARDDRGMGDLDVPAESEKVLRNYLRDGRLTHIPASHAKRRVVLDFLAAQFEPGTVYPERDVNVMLQKFHADYAALRRHLVDEEFLERRDGAYWRAGGTFEIE